MRAFLVVSVLVGTAYAESPPVKIMHHAAVHPSQLPAHDASVTATGRDKVPPGFAEALTSVLKEVDELLASDEFLEALAGVEAVEANPTAKDATTGLAVEMTMFGVPSQMRHVTFAVHAKKSGAPAQTGFDQTKATVTFYNNAVATITGTDEAERACAINTIVHEFIHTVPLTPMSTQFMYSDRGNKHSNGPLASYVLGGLAQCTFLERKHVKDVGPLTNDELAACVRATGTTIFIANCNRGWFVDFVTKLRKPR